MLKQVSRQPDGAIAALLDDQVRAWHAAGIDLEAGLGDEQQPAAVLDALVALGIDPVPELVALYSWRVANEYAGMFWEADLVALDAAVHAWTANRSVIAGNPEWERRATEGNSWPGPIAWFPVLVGVGNTSDGLVIDNGAGSDRGSLWWIMPQDDSRKVFDSLSEALRAAIFCVEAGLWTHSDGFVECARTHQPWPHDRDHPPWCDQHH